MISSRFGTPAVNDWKLVMYPYGQSTGDGNHVSIYIASRAPAGVVVRASVRISILDIMEEENHIRFFEGDFSRNSPKGASEFVSILRLTEDYLLAADKIVIKCHISVPLGGDNVSHEIDAAPVSDTSLSSDFGSLLDSEYLSDFVIKVQGREFKVHKVVLGARSKVLERMFVGRMKENLTNVLTIDNFDEETVVEIIHYMYTGKVRRLRELAQDLFRAAHLYEIRGLKERCEEHLCGNLRVEDVAQLLVLADLMEASRLKKATQDFISEYTEEVHETEDWKKMEKDFPHLITEMLVMSSSRFLKRGLESFL
jgi:speckle-type POZ protein